MVKHMLNTTIGKPILIILLGFNVKIILKKTTEDLKSLFFKLTVVGTNSEEKNWSS